MGHPVNPFEPLLHKPAQDDNPLTPSQHLSLDPILEPLLKKNCGVPHPGPSIRTADQEFLTPGGMKVIDPRGLSDKGMRNGLHGRNGLVQDYQIQGLKSSLFNGTEDMSDLGPCGSIETEKGFVRQVITVYIDPFDGFLIRKLGYRTPGDKADMMPPAHKPSCCIKGHLVCPTHTVREEEIR